MRLTMKPGVDFACTGVLPQRRDSASIACAAEASVSAPQTTSTSFISGTGLKKCMPTSRRGFAMPLASAVMLIDEVLDAISASGGSSASSSRSSACLGSSFSTITSMTSAASASSAVEAAGDRRASTASRASCSMRPFATKPSSALPIWAIAAAAAPSRRSISRTGWPACAATCAMPAPITPAPITATGACAASALAMRQVPVDAVIAASIICFESCARRCLAFRTPRRSSAPRPRGACRGRPRSLPWLRPPCARGRWSAR